MQWILGIALTVAVFWALKQWGALSPEQRRRNGWKLAVAAFLGLLLVLVLTGRVHVIVAGIAALIPLLKKLPSLLRLLPWLTGKRYGPQSTGESRNTGASGRMSEAEACEVLGVDLNCSRDEVVAAHRRLMQKLHPDRGGNDYLAAKVNEAKAVLLARHR